MTGGVMNRFENLRATLEAYKGSVALSCAMDADVDLAIAAVARGVEAGDVEATYDAARAFVAALRAKILAEAAAISDRDGAMVSWRLWAGKRVEPSGGEMDAPCSVCTGCSPAAH